MSEELDDLVENIREPSAWIRLVFMIVFALLLYFVITPIIFALMLAQAVFAIVTGDDNENLRKFAAALSQYVYQILGFLTFNAEDKPFPFSELPGIASAEEEAPAPEPAKPAPAKPAQKRAAKKRAAKKAPRKRTAEKKSTKNSPEETDGENG